MGLVGSCKGKRQGVYILSCTINSNMVRIEDFVLSQQEKFQELHNIRLTSSFSDELGYHCQCGLPNATCAHLLEISIFSQIKDALYGIKIQQ